MTIEEMEEMELHAFYREKMLGLLILRVPGGWIYYQEAVEGGAADGVFVPEMAISVFNLNND